MSPLETEIKNILSKYLSPIVAETVLSSRIAASGISLRRLRIGDRQRLLLSLQKGLGRYLKPQQAKDCMNQLESLLNSRNSVSAPAATEHQKISIRSEGDIVVARGAGRQMCKTLGFTSLLQVKLATAISELARNIVQYAGEGSITLHASHENGRPYLQVTAEDHGPGIPNLDSILSGRYVSKSGMGKGLTGTRNMVDEFDIRSSPNSGTLVVIRKWVK